MFKYRRADRYAGGSRREPQETEREKGAGGEREKKESGGSERKGINKRKLGTGLNKSEKERGNVGRAR